MPARSRLRLSSEGGGFAGMPESLPEVVDASRAASDDRRMHDDPPDQERSDQERSDIDAREAARTRRRDRDAAAASRDLMRPGMGKVFKQILDRQASAAKEPPKRRKGAKA